MGESGKKIIIGSRESMSDRWKITVNIIHGPGDRGPGTHKRIQFSRGNTGETITTLYRGGRRKYTFEEEVPCLHNETIRFITRSIEIFYLFDLCLFLYINCLKCLCLSLLPLQLHELNNTIKLIVSSITR